MSEVVKQAEGRSRPIVVHYHLFKNAGTSVDRTLRANFGATWTSVEHEPQFSPAALRRFLVENPWVAALSSHTAVLPVPELPGAEILPIVFLRHPLDRVRSIYDFERQQDARTDGATKAKEVDLAGFVEWRLDRAASVGDSAIADFQTHRLALGGETGEPLARARQAIERLPFVGIVEDFEASLARLQDLVVTRFPRAELSVVRANVTPGRPGGLDARLASLRDQLGDELYERLRLANHDDQALWRYALDRASGRRP